MKPLRRTLRREDVRREKRTANSEQHKANSEPRMSRTFSSALILALVLPPSVIAQAPAPAPGAAEREVMDIVVRLFDGMR